MQKKFADAQVEVRVRDITSDIGIPTMAAVADDVLLKDPMLLTIGIGTHTSARIAVMRAITEVAQSRLPRSMEHGKIQRLQSSVRRWDTTGQNGSTCMV